MVRPGQISDTPLRDEAEQIAFFDAAFACAQKAEAAAGVIAHDIRIGDLQVRLCFAGPALADVFMPALAHLETTSTEAPHATFHVWESAKTGVTMIKPPFPRDCVTDRGDIWGFASERIRSAFHWSEYSVNLLDLATNTGIFWVADAAALPYWSASSPMRTLFHWFLETREYQLLHAACVGTEAGGVLITGKGGVGKSTTALTCLGDGLLYAGDDYVVVRPDPEPVVFSLYATAKLRHDHSARFPGLRDLIVNADVPGDEKAVLELYPARAAALVKSIKLRAVMTPRFGSEAETSFGPIEAASLRHAAAFTTMSQLPHAGRDCYDRISRLWGIHLTGVMDLSSKAARRMLVQAWRMEHCSSLRPVMPRVHIVAALLKRWLDGTHQGGVQHQHLDYYLDEFTFRFNRRHSKARGLLFYRLAQQAVAVGPAPYPVIIGRNQHVNLPPKRV